MTCCPDIAFAVVEPLQFSTAPTQMRFDTVQGIFCYLVGTKTNRILYTHTQQILSCHIDKLPSCLLLSNDFVNDIDVSLLKLDIILGFSNADWAMNIRHR